MAGSTASAVANSHNDEKAIQRSKGKTLACHVQLLDGDEVTFDVDVSSSLHLCQRLLDSLKALVSQGVFPTMLACRFSSSSFFVTCSFLMRVAVL